jgi:chromatin remodeling complex protein RSC6
MSKQATKKTETTQKTETPKIKAPKTVKSAKTEQPAATVATPAPKAPKAPKTPKSVKTEPSVVVPEVESEPEVVAATEMSTLAGDYSEFMTKLQQMSTLLSGLKTEFRGLEKKASRELKVALKASAKRKRKTGNRQPSGFVKPTLISNELATFLGREVGSEMARTEVTREINNYIRTNKLQDTTNGRKIIADDKLMALLKVTEKDELTYFNLQRYMSPHFAKAGENVVVATVVTA